MNSSENNAHFDGSNARPFNVHAVAQQPYPSFWSQNPACSPFCVPGAGSRNGSLYFLHSVALSEYPGFFVPQSPLPTTLNRRPVFPVCYNPAPFWHYSGCGKKMKIKETQTEPLQSENMSKKQDLHAEGSSRDIGRATSSSTTDIDVETDNIPQGRDGSWSSVAQKKELHGKSSSTDTLCGDAPQGSGASEDEEMMGEGKGSLVMQFWKTFQETVRLYDLAFGRAMPENVQHNGISQSSCESRGVPDRPHEGEDPITHQGEERAVRSEQCHDVRHDAMLKSGLTTEMGKGKQGYVAVPHIPPPLHEVADRDELRDTLSSGLYRSMGGAHPLPQQRPLCTSVEAGKDPSVQSGSQKPLSIGERKPDSSSGSPGFPEKLDEEDAGEQNSYPQGAQCNKVDEATQCGVSWWQDAELERSPESSPEGSRKGTGEKSVPCGERDEEDVGEQNSYPQGAQCNKVDEATQCDVSWWQDAELERSPESSPEGSRKGTGEKSVPCGERDEEDVGEQNSYPQGAQCNKVDEATQCDVSWWQDAELERSPESSSEGSRKGTVRKSRPLALS